jgi:hypothetical protein
LPASLHGGRTGMIRQLALSGASVVRTWRDRGDAWCSGTARHFIGRRRARASRPRARLAGITPDDDGCSDEQNRCTGLMEGRLRSLIFIRSSACVSPG